MTYLSGLSRPKKTGLAAIAALFIIADADATPLYYDIDLLGSAQQPSPTPFISYVVSPEDSDSDTWFETVLKINLRDPIQSNPYDFAEFKVSYNGSPTGLTVNIGDSSTNDGGTGDAGSQSNDAEMQIGALLSDPSNYLTLQAFGNDNAPPANKVLAIVPGFSDIGRTIILTVGNDFLSWDNGNGVAGLSVSPFLYALNGQPDSEGLVNYDIYAAFNRVVGNNSRIGSGVSEVEVCLRSSADSPCFASAIPEPSTLPLSILGLFAFGLARVKWRINLPNTLLQKL